MADGMRSGAWTAIVLAGRRPERDPFTEHFGVQSKALIEVDGQPMLETVLTTLLACSEIGRVIVLAQDVDSIMAEPRLQRFREDANVTALTSGDGISRSIRATIEHGIGSWPILVTTCDNVLITPQIVGHFLKHSGGADAAVGMVSRSTMLEAYPHTTRSWMKFKGEAYTGANLFALNTKATIRALTLWADVERDRKSLIKVASHFGFVLLMRIFFRALSVEDALFAAGIKLSLVARPIILPFADAGIDVDKLADHELAETILRERASRSNDR